MRNCFERKCPYHKSEPINTGDWFENGFVNRWTCRLKGNKLVGHTETIGQPKLPSWCPLRPKKAERTAHDQKIKSRKTGRLPQL